MSVIVKVGAGFNDGLKDASVGLPTDSDSFVDAARGRAAYRADVEQLRKEYFDKQAEAQETKTALEASMAMQAASASAEAEANRQLSEQRELAGEFQSKMKANEAQIAIIQGDLNTKEAEIAQLKEELAAASLSGSEQTKELERLIAEKQQVVDAQATRIDELTAENARLAGENEELTGKIAEAERDLGIFKADKSSADTFIAQEGQAISSLLSNQEFKALVTKYATDSSFSTEELRKATIDIMNRSTRGGQVS